MFLWAVLDSLPAVFRTCHTRVPLASVSSKDTAARPTSQQHAESERLSLPIKVQHIVVASDFNREDRPGTSALARAWITVLAGSKRPLTRLQPLVRPQKGRPRHSDSESQIRSE